MNALVFMTGRFTFPAGSAGCRMTDQNTDEARLLHEIRRQFAGWKQKVESDFGKTSFQRELLALEGDQLYTNFGFASPSYVAIRLIGRLSISIGRRLGEVYDKLPRQLVQERYGLAPDVVAAKFNGLEIDLHIPYEQITAVNRDHVTSLLERFDIPPATAGIGIEVRYNFNPNDSARLRKDKHMAQLLMETGLQPICLVFSTISPRTEAIASLSRAGWRFLTGPDADRFLTGLTGVDLNAILERPDVQREIRHEMADLLAAVRESYAGMQMWSEH